MTKREIYLLYADWHKTRVRQKYPGFCGWMLRMLGGTPEEEWDFLRRPDFGWDMAGRFMWREWDAKLLLEPPYRWVRQAATYLLRDMEPGSYPEPAAVHEAWNIDRDPSLRRLVNASLLARDGTPERVAGVLDMPAWTVDAYATLFFDVRDRRDDRVYIRMAARAGMLPKRQYRVPDEPDPADAAIIEVALNGTVEEAVAAVRNGRAA